jgi:hypothetical protein
VRIRDGSIQMIPWVGLAATEADRNRLAKPRLAGAITTPGRHVEEREPSRGSPAASCSASYVPPGGDLKRLAQRLAKAGGFGFKPSGQSVQARGQPQFLGSHVGLAVPWCQ